MQIKHSCFSSSTLNNLEELFVVKKKRFEMKRKAKEKKRTKQA